VPDEFLPALLNEIRLAAAQQKTNLDDGAFQRLVAAFQKNHGLPDL
jgi:hypothetical protein